MITLILSISCSIAVSVLLKLAPRQQLNIPQIVAMNYVVATLLCLALLQPHPAQLLKPSASWLILLALGLLLPSIFIVMAAAVRHAGIVRSDAAQRLSLLIPLIAAFVLFGESLSFNKAMGIVTALIALILLLIRRKISATDIDHPVPATSHDASQAFRGAILLVGVWMGYGLIDILFKQLAREALNFTDSLLVAFILSAGVMAIWLVIQGQRWQRNSLWGGTLLGLLNFGNIYFYVSAHQKFPANPALIFSAMNIGVIAGGILVGAGFFREKLNRWNVLGLGLAVGAIVLLMPASG